MADKYVFIVRSINIKDVGDISTPEGNIKLAQLLGETATEVGKALPSLDDGGFQIVSHDLVLNGEMMTVTFLARHPGTTPSPTPAPSRPGRHRHK